MLRFQQQIFFLITLFCVFSCEKKTEKKNVFIKKTKEVALEKNSSSEVLENLVSNYLKKLAKTQENRIFYKMEALENRKNAIDDFVYKRYGAVSARATESLQILKSYNTFLKKQDFYLRGNKSASYKSIIKGDFKNNYKDTDPKELYVALNYLLEDREFIGQSDHFRLDIVDVLREILVLSSNSTYQKIKEDLHSKDSISLLKDSQEFLTMLQNLENVLATRNEFSFGVYLSEVKNLGKTASDKKLIEQIFSQKILASNYEISGLIKTLYHPLWSNYFLAMQEDLNQKTIKDSIAQFLEKWIQEPKQLPSFSVGDEVEKVLEVLEN